MKKVLIIDEDPSFIQKARETLNCTDFEFIYLTNYEQSVYTVKTENPDIVLIGTSETQINQGFKIADDIKKNFNKSTIPVVLASNVKYFCCYNFDPVDKTNYKTVDDIIEKDIDSKTLINTLKLCLKCEV